MPSQGPVGLHQTLLSQGTNTKQTTWSPYFGVLACVGSNPKDCLIQPYEDMPTSVRESTQ